MSFLIRQKQADMMFFCSTRILYMNIRVGQLVSYITVYIKSQLFWKDSLLWLVLLVCFSPAGSFALLQITNWSPVLLLYKCVCPCGGTPQSEPRLLPVSSPVYSPTANLLHASHRASIQSERGGGGSPPVQQQPWRRPGHHHLLCHLHPHRPPPPVTTATSSAEEHRVARVTAATSQRR